MTKTDLAGFAEILREKQEELEHSGHRLNGIVVERSTDELEEAEYKFARELAIASLNRDFVLRRTLRRAFVRVQNHTFGECVRCSNEISRRRLEAIPWTSFCIHCQEIVARGDDDGIEDIDQPFLNAA